MRHKSAEVSSSKWQGLDSEKSAELFARQMVELIAKRRIDEIAKHVHPHNCVLLSPYGYIDRDSAITLSAKELSEAWRLNSSFNWGFYDGSGEPIQTSIQMFFDEFIYAVDYRKTDKVSVNKPLGLGNTINNIHSQFPDAVYVEFHFAGFSPQFDGMDWRSLRLVLEAKPDVDGWWLVALVNDQWTI
jgi:hypothetical protein